MGWRGRDLVLDRLSAIGDERWYFDLRGAVEGDGGVGHDDAGEESPSHAGADARQAHNENGDGEATGHQDLCRARS